MRFIFNNEFCEFDEFFLFNAVGTATNGNESEVLVFVRIRKDSIRWGLPHFHPYSYN